MEFHLAMREEKWTMPWRSARMKSACESRSAHSSETYCGWCWAPGAKLALIGSAIGVGASLALTRFLSSLLFGIGPTDLLTFSGVAVLLTAAALVACYLPTRKAMRVDPMTALRHE
ncbi:MAG: hypothetical protein WA876_16865 [Candidatus Acidiferrales bacterium]